MTTLIEGADLVAGATCLLCALALAKFAHAIAGRTDAPNVERLAPNLISVVFAAVGLRVLFAPVWIDTVCSIVMVPAAIGAVIEVRRTAFRRIALYEATATLERRMERAREGALTLFTADLRDMIHAVRGRRDGRQ